MEKNWFLVWPRNEANQVVHNITGLSIVMNLYYLEFLWWRSSIAFFFSSLVSNMFQSSLVPRPPRLQFLIACSMQKLQAIKNWSRGGLGTRLFQSTSAFQQSQCFVYVKAWFISLSSFHTFQQLHTHTHTHTRTHTHTHTHTVSIEEDIKFHNLSATIEEHILYTRGNTSVCVAMCLGNSKIPRL